MLVVLENKEKKSSIRSTYKRSSSGDLKLKFDNIHSKCSGEPYCTKGLPTEYKEPPLAPDVEVELNGIAKMSILEQERSQGE